MSVSFFSLFGFLYSADNMKKAVQEALDEPCKKLEQALGDIDSQDMILEVRAAVHVFPDHISTPAEMLDYIYKENLMAI